MSIAITSSADRFSVNGLIFRDYINLNNLITVSLCKDRYYSRFDMLFFFGLGTRNGSYTDEQILRVGHFPMSALEKAEDLILRMLSQKDAVFDIDKELLDKEALDRRKADLKKRAESARTATQSSEPAEPPSEAPAPTSPATSQTATADIKTQGTA